MDIEKNVLKVHKVELKTSLSVSSKKDNSRCMTSSATSLLLKDQNTISMHGSQIILRRGPYDIGIRVPRYLDVYGIRAGCSPI